MPDAISGSGGHNATFSAACECFRFGLTDGEAAGIMQRFNAEKTGGEQWTERELSHKLDSAREKVTAAGEFGNKLQNSRKQRKPSTRKPRAANVGEGFPLTDTGLSERLALQHGDNLCYVSMWKKWLVWDGKRWAMDDTAAVEQLGKATVRSIYAEAGGSVVDDDRDALAQFAKKSESAQRRAAMLRLAQSEPPIPITPMPWTRTRGFGTA